MGRPSNCEGHVRGGSVTYRRIHTRDTVKANGVRLCQVAYIYMYASVCVYLLSIVDPCKGNDAVKVNITMSRVLHMQRFAEKLPQNYLLVTH